jgi:hypothetical protein
MAEVMFEALLGIIFLSMAVTGVAYVIGGGQFTGMSLIFIAFTEPILIAIYLWLLAKKAGIIKG